MIARKAAADDALVVAAKAGDAAAWRELYELLGGRLRGWLASHALLDPALDADDVANEAWLTAARRISEFSGGVDDFGGWLFVIGRNVAANVNRRSRRRATTPTDIDPRQFLTPVAVDETDALDAADWIRATLSTLTTREREVVAAIDIAGLDVAGASRLLSMSRPAVRAAHYRAMRRLAGSLAAGDADSRRAQAARSRVRPRITRSLPQGE